MNKIAIITLMGYFNFGNRLQNYALTKILNDMGYDTYSIRNWNLTKIIKEGIKAKIPFIKKYKRQRKFYKFTKQYIKEIPIKAINKNNIKNIVVGSDQVWNPKYYEEDHNLLYIPQEDQNVISYSASIGVNNIDKAYYEKYSFALKNYKKISVREKSAEIELKKITGRKDIITLIDPTLLLTKQDWQKIEKKPINFDKNKKYILNYFLGNVSKSEMNCINKFAEENECTIINILDPNDSFYVSGPEEFLYLINHAYLICTDSFHSCVFSFIYDKSFVVFKRKGYSNEMYSRIENLINVFELKNREFDGYSINNAIQHDYTIGYKKLKKEREKSIDFLKK